MAFCPHCGTGVGDADTLCRSCGQTLQSTAKKGTGVPLVVWLVAGAGCVVVGIAVLGILAAIFIPNFLDALHKAKEKRTVADLRQNSAVLLSYAVDHEVFPEVGSIDDLATVIAAAGLPEVATLDGWKRPYRYECWREEGSGPGCTSFRLASAGRDGVFEHDSLADYEGEEFDPIDYDRDVVTGDGGFIQFPARKRPAEAGPGP